ncbi:MAG: sulfite exporter TauE/SafE family protein [Pseudolabrys sp.]|nr:sulfite exporter TauE/SafE family protein [Pseudolabrys sp.]
MFDTASYLLALCMFGGAVLYTSVGHAGASFYIAAMALFAVPTAVMRPTALALNILAATFGTLRYIRAGYFRWRTVWPFLAGSVPFAFLGGGIHLPGEFYRPLVGCVLLLAGARLLWKPNIKAQDTIHDPPVWLAVVMGVGVGFLSGLTGTGGGIFLSPVVIFMGWADLRTASGCAAIFILGNSVAGLAGNYAAVKALPPELPLYAAAVLAGALVGTTFGIKFSTVYIQRALGVVLMIAGAKLIGVY